MGGAAHQERRLVTEHAALGLPSPRFFSSHISDLRSFSDARVSVSQSPDLCAVDRGLSRSVSRRSRSAPPGPQQQRCPIPPNTPVAARPDRRFGHVGHAGARRLVPQRGRHGTILIGYMNRNQDQIARHPGRSKQPHRSGWPGPRASRRTSTGPRSTGVFSITVPKDFGTKRLRLDAHRERAAAVDYAVAQSAVQRQSRICARTTATHRPVVKLDADGSRIHGADDEDRENVDGDRGGTTDR